VTDLEGLPTAPGMIRTEGRGPRLPDRRAGIGGRGLLRGLMVALVVMSAACARTGTPQGGDIPETPMEVVRTSPDTFSIVEPFDGSVSFEFDRRPSERPTDGQLRDAVVVSPRTGEVSVRHRRHGLEVEMEGGFQETTIYRITLLPTLQDLWQNRLGGPYDLFLSTGPEFEPNVLAGLVTDRLTGEDSPDVRVDAEPLDGGPVHSTVTDSTGVFTFPYLPANGYMVRAYQDMNRNREADFTEPQDSMEVTLTRGDTLIVTELALLLPDTTPAILDDVAALDSMTLELSFDDPLDPEMSLEGIQVSLLREDGDAPGVQELLHPHEWEERRAEMEAAREAQEAAQEEVVVDEPPDPDVPEEPDPAPQPTEEDPTEPELLLPGYAIVAILDSPLEPEVTYEVRVEGVTNLNGVPGGGGEMPVEGPTPPEDPPEEDEEEDPGEEDPGEGDPGENDPGGDDPGLDEPGHDSPPMPGGQGRLSP
jgi:hypothetical protein